MLGLKTPPIADILLARPELKGARYAVGDGGLASTDLPQCTVAADLTFTVPSSAEIDWLDLVLTRKTPQSATLASHGCAIVADGIASLRVRLIPGQLYTATLAAFDVEGQKSEPVALELEGPGISSREWQAKSGRCPGPTGPPVRANPGYDPTQSWPSAVAAVLSGFALAWLLLFLLWPRRKRRG